MYLPCTGCTTDAQKSSAKRNNRTLTSLRKGVAYSCPMTAATLALLSESEGRDDDADKKKRKVHGFSSCAGDRGR
jgi:hypothetical protein